MIHHSPLPDLPEPLSGQLHVAKKSTGFELQLREDCDWRWLVFTGGGIEQRCGVTPIQSLMLKAEPARLVLPYMQVMCAGLAFLRNKQSKVLQFGLGAGALNRFLLLCADIVFLRSVESELSVEQVYRQFFDMPECCSTGAQDIVIQPAEVFIRGNCDEPFNYVLVDMFDRQGLPAMLLEPRAWQNIKRFCHRDGIVAINVPFWDESSLQQLFTALRAAFSNIVFSQVPGYQNLIVYASCCELACDPGRAHWLDGMLDIDVKVCVSKMVKADD